MRATNYPVAYAVVVDAEIIWVVTHPGLAEILTWDTEAGMVVPMSLQQFSEFCGIIEDC